MNLLTRTFVGGVMGSIFGLILLGILRVWRTVTDSVTAWLATLDVSAAGMDRLELVVFMLALGAYFGFLSWGAKV